MSGYAASAFTGRTAHVISKVTIYPDTPTADVLFHRVQSTFTPQCAAAASGASGKVVSARLLHPNVPLDHARGFSVVLRRGGVDWTCRVYILGEGRIESSLLIEQRGRRFTGDTASLALSLLVSRMED